ncbi:MAG: hypothetical protein KGY75_03480 [Candidatus Cloacimonetes bacterium]|nr:hypothetical protein [Candidatus Cloacimonadota bacterium]MBS3767171.1 hypothetical protein [Candidatus Cloacimonadota bacterium]
MKNYTIRLFIIIIIIFAVGCSKEMNNNSEEFWQNDYFRQTSVITPAASDSTIKAKIDGSWKSFTLHEFPEKFMEWNVEERTKTIQTIEKMFENPGKDMQQPRLAGPHNGIVASYGFKRFDSDFKLNNAVKGMGFLPKRNKIDSVLNLLETTNDDPIMEKLIILKSFYKNADKLFDKDRQVSLELYTTPKWETQSFLNQMSHPVSTIVYLDIPSYKLKTIVRLLDPNDPELTEYEKKVVDYTNLVHSYFHGKFSKIFPTVIYYVVEIYDNSPGDADAIGHRIVPPLP